MSVPDFLQTIHPEIFAMADGSGDKKKSGGNGDASAVRIATQRVVRNPKGTLGPAVLDPALVVRFGEVSQAEAEDAWRRTLKSWGYQESSATARGELLERVAQALAISTSKDDENLDTRFTMDAGNSWLGIRDLYENMKLVSPGRNDSYLRVFIRSFRYAYFACAISDLLANPANIELRQDLAVRSGGKVEDAYLMHDTFSACYTLGGRSYTQHELELHVRYRSERNTRAQARAVEAGLAGPKNDVSSKEMAKSGSESRMAPVPKVAAHIRTGFTPVDPRM